MAGTKLIRNLLKEFRFIGTKSSKGYDMFSWRSFPAYEQMIKEFKALMHETDKGVIERQIFEGELYLQYIQSARREQELENLYKGGGERPVEEIAARVGLQLPEKYQDEK